MNNSGDSPVCMRPFTTESFLALVLNVFVLEKRSFSWVFSQAATDVNNREPSSRAHWEEDNRSPNTAAAPSQWDPTWPDNGNTENKAWKNELFMIKHGNRTSTLSLLG